MLLPIAIPVLFRPAYSHDSRFFDELSTHRIGILSRLVELTHLGATVVHAGNSSYYLIHFSVPSSMEKGPDILVQDATRETSESPPVSQKPLGWARMLLVVVAFSLAASLTSLDQTIIATALPPIASEFQAVSQLSWIASAYFLPQAGLMLLFGKILSISSGKIIFLATILTFELGSLLCAVATSVDFLIVGRLISGIGAAGLWLSVLTVVSQISTLEQRPLLLGAFGAVFAVSSIVGPLLGGVFSDKLTWRWCFWINLPLGGTAFLAVLIFLPYSKPPEDSSWQAWLGLDWIGSLLSTAMVILFLLPLQWGGNDRPWNDPVVIALFALSGFLLCLFILWEYRTGDDAILPLKMLQDRTQIGACLSSFFLYICFVIGIYYLPFLYQAKGHSPTHSGIDILAFMLCGVFASVGAGVLANLTGRYWPWLFFPPFVSAVGSGLFTTVTSHTSSAKLIGYQLLFGFGVGAAIQNAVLAVQAEYSTQPKRVSQATSLCTFSQLLGLSVGVAAGGALFGNEVIRALSKQNPPLPPDVIQLVRQSVEVISSLPQEIRDAVIESYTKALSTAFYLSMPAAILASLSALLIKNHSLKRNGITGPV